MIRVVLADDHEVVRAGIKMILEQDAEIKVVAEAADGTLGTVEVYANQTISWYEPAEAVPDRLVGRKGALLLDEAGKAVGFLPDDSSHRTLRPAEVAADGITAAGGGTYAISSGTRVLLDGAVSTYGDCWYELEGREQVTLY